MSLPSVTAAGWYRLAAGQGHPKAANKLSNCYFYGHGVDQDNVQGIVGPGRCCLPRYMRPFTSSNEVQPILPTTRGHNTRGAMGLADIARHVIGCHLFQYTRVDYACALTSDRSNTFACPCGEAWLREAAGKGFGLAQHNLAAGPLVQDLCCTSFHFSYQLTGWCAAR